MGEFKKVKVYATLVTRDFMRIETRNSMLSDLRNLPKVSGNGEALPPESKSIGETPPKLVPFEELGELAALFARGGKVSRLQRRLNRLKNKKCKVAAAKGTIACIDDNDQVYLGVDFLSEILEHPDGEAILAGVMAHEWGHACAERPDSAKVQQMNWNEIFAERRSHEAFADEMSGKLLALLGYEAEPVIGFLTSQKDTHNLKYHDQSVRAELIRKGFAQEKQKQNLAKDLFKDSTYPNNYTSTIVDDDL